MAGRRSGIQLCYPMEEDRLTRKWGFPHKLPGVYCQPKLDGERCRVEHFDGGLFLLSSEQNPFFFLSHIEQSIQTYFPNVELDGELYVHGLPFEQIHSIVSRKVNAHEQAFMMEYHVFDLCLPHESQSTRLRLLKDMFSRVPEGEPVKRVPTSVCSTVQDLYDLYDSYRVEGYEGIVVRHPAANYVRTRSTNVMKFKPKKFDEYLISECVEATSITNEPLHMLGAFWCVDEDGRRFKVGAGELTHDQRKTIWQHRDSYLGRVITVGYQSFTDRGVPRFGLTINIQEPNHG